MTDLSRRLGRTLSSLVLALLNATLILLALCLWLGCHLLTEARGVAAGLSERAAILQPLQSEVLGLRADVAGLRADLAARQASADPAAGTAALAERLAALDARISATTDRLDELVADPGLMVDRAVDRAVLRLGSGLGLCVEPAS